MSQIVVKVIVIIPVAPGCSGSGQPSEVCGITEAEIESSSSKIE